MELVVQHLIVVDTISSTAKLSSDSGKKLAHHYSEVEVSKHLNPIIFSCLRREAGTAD
jgi:hypothetical protein